MTRTIRVALLQLPAYSIEQASLEHTLRRIDDAARERPDVIVLPEVSYPAYFLGTKDLRGAGIVSPADAGARIAAKAREHHAYIAAGLAVEAEGGGYQNAAVLFGRDGETLGAYAKSFLWHFDAKWFAPGDAYPVFETDAGRLGMLICADGRLPEIARSLALNDAQIILDLTAWVSSGRQPQDLTSNQREYLMPARAAENGVWVVAADKFGVEAASIVYCGRSCVINPQGEVVASLGPEEDAVLVYDVPLDDDPRPPVERRPELYRILAEPTERLPVLRTLAAPITISESDARVAAVQMSVPASPDDFVAAAGRHVHRLALQDADLVVLPAVPAQYAAAYAHAGVPEQVQRLAAEARMIVAFAVPDTDGGQRMQLVGPEGVLASHRQTHRLAGMPLAVGDAPAPVVETRVGRVGLMSGAEGFAPEVARSLMLRGAEIIAWCETDPPLPALMFARARADENCMYVIAAGASHGNGAAAVVDPGGRPVAVALEGREFAASASINRALSRVKSKAPGTDVVRNRRPGTYGPLVQHEGARERVL